MFQWPNTNEVKFSRAENPSLKEIPVFIGDALIENYQIIRAFIALGNEHMQFRRHVLGLIIINSQGKPAQIRMRRKQRSEYQFKILRSVMVHRNRGNPW